MYKLKPKVEAFTVVNGPFALRDYKPGIVYAEIPPQHAQKFEEIKEETQEPEVTRKTRSNTKNAASSEEKKGG